MLLSKSFSAGFGGQGRNIPLGLPEPAFFRFVAKLFRHRFDLTFSSSESAISKSRKFIPINSKQGLAEPAALEANQLGKSHLGSDLSTKIPAMPIRS